MRITMTMITMTALMGLGAQAAKPGVTSATKVTVCMDLGSVSAESMARMLASEMFSGIGVTITWRNPRGCPAEAILISLTDDTPENLSRGTLAYALPYEGSTSACSTTGSGATGRNLRRACSRTFWFTRSPISCKESPGIPQAA
jgi:hypothetical protein